MKRRLCLQALPAFLAAPAVVAAEKYPSKPITWICPYGAGGNADTRSRLVAKVMSTQLGQPIVVDNKAGAGGNIGTEFIARAKPDGYTIGMGNFAPLAVNHALFKKLNFDPLNDIVPITLIERGPLALLIRAESPWKSVSDLVNAAKAAPGKLSYASGGLGGTHHLSAALFEHVAGIDMIHVPYKGTGSAMPDVISGQVDMSFPNLPSGLPHVKSGSLRALGVTTAKRSAAAPNIPTIAESGLPGYDMATWYGLVAPANLSVEIRNRINKELQGILADPKFKDKLIAQGADPMPGTPEQFSAFIKAEIEKWRKLIAQSQITID